MASTDQFTPPATICGATCGATHPQTDAMRKTGLILKPCQRPRGHIGRADGTSNPGHVFLVDQVSEATQ